MEGTVSMLRTFGGAAVANTSTILPQKPLSSTSSSSSSSSSSQPHKPISLGPTNLSVSSSASPFIFPNSPVPTSPANFSVGSSCCDDFDWVSVDGSEDCFSTGHAPSPDEVHNALSALCRVLSSPSCSDSNIQDDLGEQLAENLEDGTSSDTDQMGKDSSAESVSDWMEPPTRLWIDRMPQPYLYDRFYDALHLLQTEPSIQRMVVSLTSDKAVWDAVMNNEVVREIIPRAEYNLESSDEKGEQSDPAKNLLKDFFASSRAKLADVIDKITTYVTNMFNLPEDEKTEVIASGWAAAAAADKFETTDIVVEKLHITVLLSVVVLLIVVATRALKA